MTRVLIYGGRDYTNEDDAFRVLDDLHAQYAFNLVIEGGATGADRLGRRWAESRSVPFVTYNADWKKLDAPGAIIRWNQYGQYNANAGYARNLQMADEGKPDVGVEFPGGRGTANMRAILKKRGIDVIEA